MTSNIRPGSLRVIFDRSAFHGDRFTALKNSPLLELCRKGAVAIFHSEPFIEETLLTYGGGNGNQSWQEHLAFALDACNGGLFLERDVIWRNELVVGRGPFAQYLLPDRHNKRHDSKVEVMERLRAAASAGDISTAWAESEAERAETQKKKAAQRSIFGKIRNEVAQGLKGGRVIGSPKDYPFQKFLASTFIRTGREFMDTVDRERATRLAAQWAQSPKRFPFYSAFVEGLAYSGYYAAVEHNQPLDENAQVDFEQLCYLTWADVFVSDDHRFMRCAFDAMWKPRGKRFATAVEFAALLERLT